MTTPDSGIYDNKIELEIPPDSYPGVYRASATFQWTGSRVLKIDEAAIVAACSPPPPQPEPMSESDRQMIALGGLLLTLVIFCVIVEWKSKRAAAMD